MSKKPSYKENCYYFTVDETPYLDGVNDSSPDFEIEVDCNIKNNGMKSLLFSTIIKYLDNLPPYMLGEDTFYFKPQDEDYFTFSSWMTMKKVDFKEMINYLTSLGFECVVEEEIQ